MSTKDDQVPIGPRMVVPSAHHLFPVSATLRTVVLVFSLTVGRANAQTLTTLYSLDHAHGQNPWGDLTLSGSTLYGMAQTGGAYGYGTAFSIPVAGGTPTILCSFDSTHGSNPHGSLSVAAGKGTIFAESGEPGCDRLTAV